MKINNKELEKVFLEIKQNKTDGVENLYNKYKKVIYGIAFMISKNQEDAEDIMQIVFAKIYKLEKSKIPINNYASWLYSITKNETINYLKKKKNDIPLDKAYEIPNDNNELNKIIDNIEFNKLISKLNDKEEKFDDLHWEVKRKTTENTVQVIFYGYLLELTEIPVICEYDLDSSLYQKNYDLTYLQRKDMGVKQIARINQFDNTDFDVYTLGGDVIITIEQDMVYSLEDALNQKVITVNSILEQAKLDAKYGICEAAFYKDGGSIEYRYKDYTILKFNTLDGNKDLIIGMSDSIINNEYLKNRLYT
ncbi:MAG: RNA polymerase sigma factor [Clostridia bacterium]|nr:sigma-70 family RNA polymerase sigma factor [Clostridium sp.]